jgi:protein-S-isoprenylcysteine O-methyltransferase Ste14
MIDNLPAIVLAAVLLSWFIFAAAFLLIRKPKSDSPAPDRKRAPASIVGIVLQGFSYGLVWTVRRPFLSFPFHFSATAGLVWAVVTVAIAAVSVWFSVAAVRTLGKEWSLTARVVEGHRLVRSGPYAWVRHPIYTGMLGMLLATGFAVGHWLILSIGLVIFLVGTFIRVRSEERLLRETFGAEFEEYSRRVPAIIPFLV